MQELLEDPRGRDALRFVPKKREQREAARAVAPPQPPPLVSELQAENERLRAACRRYKRKLQQERQVNEELGKRVKRWKQACGEARVEADEMRELLRGRAALVSPVSSLESLESPFFAPGQDLLSLTQREQREQRGAAPAPLRVRVPAEPRQLRDCNAKAELLTHVARLERGGAVEWCWPAASQHSLPDSLAQFCFPDDAERRSRNSFVFMLTGEAATPLEMLPSCTDAATFGVCLPLEADVCLCVLSRHPFFEPLVALLEGLAAAESDKQRARRLTLSDKRP